MYYAEEAVCCSGMLITKYHAIWCLNLHSAENIHLCKNLGITKVLPLVIYLSITAD
jgi:hypothetical protein